MCQCVFLHFICFLAFPVTLFLLFVYFVLFPCHCLILAVCLFSDERLKKGLDLGGQGSREDLVDIDRGETLIEI